MRGALLVFLAAAAFFAATSVGVLRLGSSRSAPAVIVVRGHGTGAARSGSAHRVPGRTAVRQRVEKAKLSAYRAARAGARGAKP
jgi:hypothetical protein